jgi:hypothetical protein
MCPQRGGQGTHCKVFCQRIRVRLDQVPYSPIEHVELLAVHVGRRRSRVHSTRQSIEDLVRKPFPGILREGLQLINDFRGDKLRKPLYSILKCVDQCIGLVERLRGRVRLGIRCE